MSPQKIINPELYFSEHDKEADKMCHTVPYTAKATKPEMLCKNRRIMKIFVAIISFYLGWNYARTWFCSENSGYGTSRCIDKGADRKRQSKVHIHFVRKLRKVLTLHLVTLQIEYVTGSVPFGGWAKNYYCSVRQASCTKNVLICDFLSKFPAVLFQPHCCTIWPVTNRLISTAVITLHTAHIHTKFQKKHVLGVNLFIRLLHSKIYI